MCRILNISTSGFYGWLKEPGGKRRKDDEALCDQIKKAFDASRQTYGSRRIRRELKKLERGCTLRRIRRLMRKLGLCPKRRRRFRSTTNSKHGFKVYDNLLKRFFKVNGPDQVWVSDITYIWTGEGWLFLATVIDLFSRKVVGWSMSESLKSKIAIDALARFIHDHGGPSTNGRVSVVFGTTARLAMGLVGPQNQQFTTCTQSACASVNLCRH
jgi:transposase InsO family protein